MRKKLTYKFENVEDIFYAEEFLKLNKKYTTILSKK